MHHPHLQVSGPEYLPPWKEWQLKQEGIIEADTHTKKGYLLQRKAWRIEAKCRNDPRIACKEGNRPNIYLRNEHSVPSVKLYAKGRNQHPQGGFECLLYTRNWNVLIPQVVSFHSHNSSVRSNIIAPSLQLENLPLNDGVTCYRYPGWWKAVLRFEPRQSEMKSDLLNPMFSVPNCYRTISVSSLSVGVT